ncbi:MAG: GNAT family N-acetyltransferase [Pseudomonadota bacterium]
MAASSMQIVPFGDQHRSAVLRLFDDNAPAFFHPDEREALTRFLSQQAAIYRVVVDDGEVIGAFGLRDEGERRGRIVWFMAAPSRHGQGVGRLMIEHLLDEARARGVTTIDIAASHVSEAFYIHFGATRHRRVEDGWGEGMHRVDMILEI